MTEVAIEEIFSKGCYMIMSIYITINPSLTGIILEKGFIFGRLLVCKFFKKCIPSSVLPKF